MSDYHAEFEEALREALMLLEVNHPTRPFAQGIGASTEGDLPQCRMVDGMVNQLYDAVGPLMLVFISHGQPVQSASVSALSSVIRSALEMGFATGRVFQSHGFNVPAR